MKTPLSQKTVKKEKDVSYKSDMVGLPSKVVKEQKATMKKASSGPRYEIKKNGSGVSSKTSTPLYKKKIVEKATGEKYASKSAMMKHEKSESKTEQKKEYGRVKRSPVKMKNC
jgi:hypothetical protein